MDSKRAQSTIGIRRSTKEKLDKNRAPGQSYDGFICQMVDMWEGLHSNGKALASKN